MAIGPLKEKQVSSLCEYASVTQRAMDEVYRLKQCLEAREKERDNAQTAVDQLRLVVEKAQHTYDMENRRLTLFVCGFPGPAGLGL